MWKEKDIIYHCLLFAGFAIVLLGWNHVIELRAEEPRRAVVAMEMILSGEYIVPQINGWPYFNKPPLFNWVLVLFFKLFNSFDEWVVRLPGILSLLLSSLILVKFGKKYISLQAGWIAALFLVASLDLLFYGSINAGEIDLFYMLLVSAQAFSIFHYAAKKKLFKLFVISYIFCALGFLTKGPPSLVFQFLSLFGWLILKKQWKFLVSWAHLTGIIIFFILCSSYFILYEQQHSSLEFLVRLLKESSQRTAAESKLTDIAAQLFLFPIRSFAILFPGSILLYIFIRRGFLVKIKANPLVYFSFFFVLINLPLYWISGEFKARYLYPFFPFACILFAYAWSLDDRLSFRRKLHIDKLLGFIILLSLISIWVPFKIDILEAQPYPFYKILFPFILLALIFYAFIKYQRQRMLLFLTSLLVLRLMFNIVILPAWQSQLDSLKYRNISEDILDITGTNSVHFYGDSFRFSSEIRIGSAKLFSSTHNTAALMAYQIPYYLMKKNRQVLLFEEKMKKDQYYLAPKYYVDENEIDILYSYIEGWYNWQIVLIKLK
jgi:hypothetical protein